MGCERDKMLFPTDLPGPEWVEFEAAGFGKPVTGVIYRGGKTDHGMPLGAIATGYINLDTDGTLGHYTLFNYFMPPPPQAFGLPFLGLEVGEKTWVLSLNKIEGVENATQIYYWGHYPVADIEDIEYETDAPLSVGLRAWAPFLLGDSAASNTPGAVFEVYLRNTSATSQQGTIAISFPGAFRVGNPGRGPVRTSESGW
jgi:uncharacterized protein (DUF608 family)